MTKNYSRTSVNLNPEYILKLKTYNVNTSSLVNELIGIWLNGKLETNEDKIKLQIKNLEQEEFLIKAKKDTLIKQLEKTKHAKYIEEIRIKREEEDKWKLDI